MSEYTPVSGPLWQWIPDPHMFRYVPPEWVIPAEFSYQSPARKVKAIEYFENGGVKRVEYEDK